MRLPAGRAIRIFAQVHEPRTLILALTLTLTPTPNSDCSPTRTLNPPVTPTLTPADFDRAVDQLQGLNSSKCTPTAILEKMTLEVSKSQIASRLQKERRKAEKRAKAQQAEAPQTEAPQEALKKKRQAEAPQEPKSSTSSKKSSKKQRVRA